MKSGIGKGPSYLIDKLELGPFHGSWRSLDQTSFLLVSAVASRTCETLVTLLTSRHVSSRLISTFDSSRTTSSRIYTSHIVSNHIVPSHPSSTVGSYFFCLHWFNIYLLLFCSDWKNSWFLCSTWNRLCSPYNYF